MSDPYAEWKIAEYTYWAVYLHESQYYLGRCYIWLKRDVVDLMDVSVAEYLELMFIANKVKQALGSLWAPDLYNWAALGNCTPHCHMHLIPRYQSLREFDGKLFIDKRWAKNYAPYDREFRVPVDTLQKIRRAVEHQLQRHVKLASQASHPTCSSRDEICCDEQFRDVS